MAWIAEFAVGANAVEHDAEERRAVRNKRRFIVGVCEGRFKLTILVENGKSGKDVKLKMAMMNDVIDDAISEDRTFLRRTS